MRPYYSDDQNRFFYEEEEIQLTLFVGAIGSQATQQSLTEYFKAFGKVSKVKIIVDWATKQSKECALVYFTSHESLHRVLQCPKHFINDRIVRVEYADRTKKGTKVLETSAILVSNIKYYSLHDTILEYFSTYGQITDCTFYKDSFKGKVTKSVIIRFEKKNAIERILITGKIHRIGNNEVYCNPQNNSLENVGENQVVADNQEDIGYHHRQPTFQSANRNSVPDHYTCEQHRAFRPSDVERRDSSMFAASLPHHAYDNYQVEYSDSPPVVSARLEYYINKQESIRSKSYLLPLEYQKDTLFSIFCDVPQRPDRKVDWKSLIAIGMKPVAKKI